MAELPSDSSREYHVYDATSGNTRYVVQRVADDGEYWGFAFRDGQEIAYVRGRRIRALVDTLIEAAQNTRGK